MKKIFTIVLSTILIITMMPIYTGVAFAIDKSEYFCLRAEKDNSTVKLKFNSDVYDIPVPLEYSTDLINWHTYRRETITLPKVGNKVYFRAIEENSGLMNNHFVMTGNLAAGGDITTLLNPNGTKNLSSECFNGLFSGCSELTKAPDLPATTLAEGCYDGMFSGCSGLKEAPDLPATTLAEDCYNNMFYGCTGLTKAPRLPATKLAEYCYAGMFDGCKGLTEAPKLLATELAGSCYAGMFKRCIKLTEASELPATTLAEDCYDSMFYGCTGLTEAPKLPATELKKGCYKEMFTNCQNLKKIEVSFTNWMDTTGYNSSSATWGWTINIGINGTFICPNNLSNVRGDCAIPDKWLVNKYQVTFDTQGWGNNLIQTIDIDSKLTKPQIASRTGYTVDDWYMESSCKKNWDFENESVTDSMTLYAKWKPLTYKITFDANGGAFASGTNTTIDVIYDSTYILPKERPTREGYIFDRWHTSKTGGEWITMSEYVKITSDTTLYAHWKPNKLKVTFDANDGTFKSGTRKITDVIYDSKYVLPNEEPTREGYIFGGWYASKTSEDRITTNTDVKITSDTTMYAHWAADIYDITYKDIHDAAFSGTHGLNHPTTHTYGIATNLVNPTKEGYTFEGWFKDSNCANASMTSIGATDYTDDFILYAKWTENAPNEYTVSFNMNGHGLQINAQTVTEGGKAILPLSPTDNNYTFGGWYTNAECTSAKWDFSSVITENKILYAKWTKNEIVIPPGGGTTGGGSGGSGGGGGGGFAGGGGGGGAPAPAPTTEQAGNVKVDASGNATISIDKKEATIKNEELAKVTKQLSVKTKDCELVLDKTTLDTIKEKAAALGKGLELSAAQVKANSKEVRLQFTATVGGTKITDFNGGTVEVNVKLPAGLSKKNLQAIYIGDDGKAEKVEGKENADGTFTMYLKHFSEYAIMSSEDAEALLPKITDEDVKAIVSKVKVTTRTENQKKGIKIYVNDIKELKEIKDAGYTVVYDFYNAQQKKTPKNSQYVKTKVVNKKTGAYLNTGTKKGKTYYYKVILKVKDENGKVIAKTTLSQSKYGKRTRK